MVFVWCIVIISNSTAIARNSGPPEVAPCVLSLFLIYFNQGNDDKQVACNFCQLLAKKSDLNDFFF